ncbi:MAG: hypothetical protein HZA61_11635 [Candidatus Eisenbacteria bacterium]|uniref:Uncharacterized protein n=1 Tax=Eiseniibacteriota bacterium TaxID=2212470 RepID=A0A933SE95_UNCEI|nr:hypothetical protein [Candidatus Eisenbacteria bacterium]
MNCPEIDRLSQPGAWTEAERAHVEGCARCLALSAEYAAFTAGNSRVSADEAAGAHARLSSFVDRITSEGAPAGASACAAAQPPRAGWLARFAQWCAGPQGRLAVGFAAVAIVAGVVFVPRAMRGPQVGDTARGGAGTERQAELLTVVAAGAGAYTVTWLPMPGAESYLVEVLDPLFAVVHSANAGASLTWTLEPGTIGAGAYVRVIALRQGDRILEQGPMALPGK